MMCIFSEAIKGCLDRESVFRKGVGTNCVGIIHFKQKDLLAYEVWLIALTSSSYSFFSFIIV